MQILMEMHYGLMEVFTTNIIYKIRKYIQNEVLIFKVIKIYNSVINTTLQLLKSILANIPLRSRHRVCMHHYA